MKLMLRDDFSPCTAKDPKTGIGVVLIPGTLLDTEREGIVDAVLFQKTYAWAFDTSVEDASASPGSKRFTKRLP